MNAGDFFLSHFSWILVHKTDSQIHTKSFQVLKTENKWQLFYADYEVGSASM